MGLWQLSFPAPVAPPQSLSAVSLLSLCLQRRPRRCHPTPTPQSSALLLLGFFSCLDRHHRRGCPTPLPPSLPPCTCTLLALCDVQTREFNAGERRRKMLGQGQDATFFSSSNASAASTRDRIALETLDELLEWLKAGHGYVGVFDGVLQ
jgi:hypothetical protein